MKLVPLSVNCVKSWLLVILIFLSYGCEKKEIPQEFVGKWKSNKHLITVRSEPEKREWIFTTDSAYITLHIKPDFSVEGSIGNAVFKNGILKSEWLFLQKEGGGVPFSIECGSIGKIFETEPIDAKEVELWLSIPEGSFEAELRYTQGGSHFPMAGMVFTSVDQ